MKRIVPILLAVCMLLCACGNKPAEATEPSQTAAPTTEATVPPTTEPETEPTTEPTEPPVLFRHPLNGMALNAPWTGRATAVVINNIWEALPHHGVSQADILYEVETEGGITRCLAIFSELVDVGKLGPVRSARTFFSNLAVSYDAPLVHCGGSNQALNGQYDDSGDTISDWAHVDAFYNDCFYRDNDRYENQGYAWEHTLFTDGELLLKGLANKGYDTLEEVDYGLLFKETVELQGESAKSVIVNFRGGKTTTMTYNADTGLYEAAQYGKDYVDANTGEVMTFRNVLVLYADQWKDADGYRSFYDLIGSGEGVFACDGQLVKILWSRPTLRDHFTYTLEDGTPITLGVGSSYIGVASPKAPATYQ